jgi:hypothetical protein
MPMPVRMRTVSIEGEVWDQRQEQATFLYTNRPHWRWAFDEALLPNLAE